MTDCFCPTKWPFFWTCHMFRYCFRTLAVILASDFLLLIFLSGNSDRFCTLCSTTFVVIDACCCCSIHFRAEHPGGHSPYATANTIGWGNCLYCRFYWFIYLSILLLYLLLIFFRFLFFFSLFLYFFLLTYYSATLAPAASLLWKIEDCCPFLKDGCCYARSVYWLKIVP